MVRSGVLLAQSFEYERALAFLADKFVFWGLVSFLEHAGHFRLLYEGEIGLMVAASV